MRACVRRSPSELSLDGADGLPHYEGLLTLPASLQGCTGDISPASSAPCTPANGTVWRTLECPGAPVQPPARTGCRVSPTSLASSAAATPRLLAWASGTSTPADGADNVNFPFFPTTTPPSSAPSTPANAVSTRWRSQFCPHAPARRNGNSRRSASADSSAPRTPADAWPSTTGTPIAATPTEVLASGVPQPAALRLAICGAKLDLEASRRLSGMVGDLFEASNAKVRVQSADSRADLQQSQAVPSDDEESVESPSAAGPLHRRRQLSLQLSIPSDCRRPRFNSSHGLAAVPESPGPSPGPSPNATPLCPQKVDWNEVVSTNAKSRDNASVDAIGGSDYGSSDSVESQRLENAPSRVSDAIIETPSPKACAPLDQLSSAVKAEEQFEEQALTDITEKMMTRLNDSMQKKRTDSKRKTQIHDELE